MASGLAERFQTLHELVKAARATLTRGPWDYLVGGTETETTVRRNRGALDAIAFRPRVLRDVSRVDSASTFLGRSVRLPILLAPIGGLETFDPGGGATHQAGVTWDHVKRFKDTHEVPLILKGVATAEDATLCVEHGVDVVYVSNHGGRQLDHGRGTMEVLPEVLAAVRGRARVIVDGGFVRGTDVVKAVATGADLVGLGRLPCFG